MKTRYNRLVVLMLPALFMLGSCVEDQEDYLSKYCPGSCTEVSGQVRQGSNGQPVPGVQLVATWNNLPTFKLSLGGTTRKKAVAYTDAQGNYTLRFLLRDDEMLDGQIEVTPQGSNCSLPNCRTYTLYPEELKRDTTYTRHFLLP